MDSNTQKDNFAHLHLHTKYSMLDGAIKIDELAEHVKEMGEKSEYIDKNNLAVAMTDHGGVHGAVDFYKTMKKKHNIKPILGCEVYTAKDDDRFNKATNNPYAYNHLILLAKNNTGWSNLMKISSRGYLDGLYVKPRVDSAVLEKYSEGVIALSGCVKGKVQEHILEDEYDQAKEWAKRYCDIFGKDDFYLEIQYHDIDDLDEDKLLRGMVRLHEDMGLSFATTADAHFLREDYHLASRHLTAIQSNDEIDDPNAFSLDEDLWVKGPQELINSFPEMYQDYAEMGVKETGKIAAKCDVELELGVHYLPSYPIPEQKEYATDLEFTDSIWDDAHEHNDIDSLNLLGYLIEQGLEEEYGDDVPDEAIERINHELDTIVYKGYTDYFLVVHDFIEWAKNGREGASHEGVGRTKEGELIEDMDGGGIRVGPGRGSAASCFIAYLIGITDKVNPLDYDLLFERFLNPEREALPDIDVDFTRADRDYVMDYVREKYGEKYVAQLGTFGMLKGRSTMRDVGRIRGYEKEEIDELTEHIPDPPNDYPLDEALGFSDEVDEPRSPNLYQKYQNDKEIQTFLDVCMKLTGLCRHASTHAAGLLISPAYDPDKPVMDYVPLQYDKDDDRRYTQFDMDAVKKVGGVKFDFLGLKTLDIVSLACKNIRERTGNDLYPGDIPLEDKKAFELLSAGETTGVFQCGSDWFKNYVQQMQPENFEHVIAGLALNRPGPISSGMPKRYEQCMHGNREPEYAHEDLKPILEDTYGECLYQEQIMQICRHMAGYSLGDADLMRRAIGKKDEEEMRRQEKIFINGMTDNGYDRELAEELFDMIKEFAEYGFNKSHSAAYGAVTMETAYLKAHHPTEFMAATLAVEQDQDNIADLIQDFQRQGYEVIAPHINKSGAEFMAIEEDVIAYGLSRVKHCSSDGAEAIINERKENGDFKSLSDFVQRMDSRVDKTTIESLGAAGAFDCFDLSRRGVVESAKDINNRISDDSTSPAKKMFSDEAVPFETGYKEYDDYGQAELMEKENDLLGYPIVASKIEGEERENLELMTEIRLEYTDRLDPLEDSKKQQKIMVGGIVTDIRTHQASNGEMAWITMSDWTGEIEVTAFNRTWGSHKDDILKVGNVIIGCVSVDTYRGDLNFILEQAHDVLGDKPAIRNHWKKQIFKHSLDNIKLIEKENTQPEPDRITE